MCDQTFISSAFPGENVYPHNCVLTNHSICWFSLTLPMMRPKEARMEPKGALSLCRRWHFSSSYSALILHDLIFQANVQIVMQLSSRGEEIYWASSQNLAPFRILTFTEHPHKTCLPLESSPLFPVSLWAQGVDGSPPKAFLGVY